MPLFDIINVPMGYILKWCSYISGNYVVTLLFFALVMQILLFPLGIKQQKNMVKQAKMRPKEMAIRKKYAGRTDRPTQQKMQQEIMELYQAENFNPASGCLPLLIQLPIIFSLFNVVTQPLRYICGISKDASALINAQLLGDMGIQGSSAYPQISLISAIQRDGLDAILAKLGGDKQVLADALRGLDVGSLPNFSLANGFFDLSQTPTLTSWLVLIPIITVVAMLVSQWLNKKFMYRPQEQTEGDAAKSMKIMEWTMPLMCFFFAFQVPGAIGVYWIYRNILSVVQQFVLSKMYPYPKFTEEDYKEAERAMNSNKSRKKSTANADPNRPRPRSLHHIDDEDYIQPPVEEKAEPTELPPVPGMKTEDDRPRPDKQ